MEILPRSWPISADQDAESLATFNSEHLYNLLQNLYLLQVDSFLEMLRISDKCTISFLILCEGRSDI